MGKNLFPDEDQLRVQKLCGAAPLLLVNGCPGSGKSSTIVRCVEQLLIEIDPFTNMNASVLVLTFNRALTKYLNTLANKQDIIIAKEERNNQLIISNFHKFIWQNFLSQGDNSPRVISENEQKEIIITLLNSPYFACIQRINVDLLLTEISFIKQNLLHLEEQKYIEVSRRGRYFRLTGEQRLKMFKLCKEYCSVLQTKNLIDFDDFALVAINALKSLKHSPFTHVIIDEAQDFTSAEFLVANLLANQTLSLFFDEKQKIYTRGSLGKFLQTLKNDPKYSEKIKRVTLHYNYRNCLTVAQTAVDILGPSYDKRIDLDLSKLKRSETGGITQWYQYKDSLSAYNFLVNTLVPRLEKEYGTVVVTTCQSKKQSRDNLNEWLKSKNFLAKSEEDFVAEYNKKGICFSSLHKLKGLEFDCVVIFDFNEFSFRFRMKEDLSGEDEDISAQNLRLIYTNITRARFQVIFVSSATPAQLGYRIKPEHIKIIDNTSKSNSITLLPWSNE